MPLAYVTFSSNSTRSSTYFKLKHSLTKRMLSETVKNEARSTVLFCVCRHEQCLFTHMKTPPHHPVHMKVEVLALAP